MYEIGEVREIKDGRATVVFQRTAACKGCNACMKLGERELMVVVDNTENAKVGDKVAVAMEGSSVMSAAAVMYGGPFAGLMLGVGIPMLCGTSDWVSALCGIAVALSAYGVIKLCEPKLSKKKRFRHRMDHVVKEDEIKEKEK